MWPIVYWPNRSLAWWGRIKMEMMAPVFTFVICKPTYIVVSVTVIQTKNSLALADRLQFERQVAVWSDIVLGATAAALLSPVNLVGTSPSHLERKRKLKHNCIFKPCRLVRVHPVILCRSKHPEDTGREQMRKDDRYIIRSTKRYLN